MLFQAHLEKIELAGPAGCYLLYTDAFLSAQQAAALYDVLLAEVPWQQEQVRVYGKVHPAPRLTAWYGDANARYAYSGVMHDPLPWRDDLAQLRQQLSELAATPFNSVLLNYYRNGEDSVSWHSDDEPELGRAPVIASLSLGTTRRFRLRPKVKTQEKRQQKAMDLDLSAGSLLIMAGNTQHHWQHAIPKQKGVSTGRINLTFREIKSL